MRNPPDNPRFRSPDNTPPNQGGRRARTIRDMFDQPLRRLTSVPALRRRPMGRPNAGGGSGRANPPDLYGQGERANPPHPKRPRWTEPGTWVREQGPPAPPDARRPDRGPAPASGARGPVSRPPAGPAPMSGPPERSGASADLRWKQPEWLGKAPLPGEIPPSDPAPPTLPRYGAGNGPSYGPGAAETPQYQPDERDPQRQQTNYRATSVRSALWASRTPGYQPDQAPVEPERNTSDDRAYFEAYNTRRTPASLAHVGASLATDQADSYVPGTISEVERLRREEQTHGRTAGPAPYFWEMMKKPKATPPMGVAAFWLIALLLIGSALLTFAYSGVSVYAASQMVYAPQVALKGTPKDDGLVYKDIVFTSRTDHLLLHGWFIPGVASPGHLTTARTIIVVHGIRANRTDPGAGLLDLSAALAKHGLAVLAFDMRGSGESTSAPTSLGYFEQRDVLGAVDFLQSGPVPYPDLGRPKAIGGLGISMGAATLLLAAAQEPALRAIVADSAYADVMPILQREIPQRSHLSHVFTPGILEASQVMYGIDYYADKPEAVVARIAPRPILFIHGGADTYVSPENMTLLTEAAEQAPKASVQSWLVPNATHAQAFHVAGQAYVSRVVDFFMANLSTTTNPSTTK